MVYLFILFLCFCVCALIFDDVDVACIVSIVVPAIIVVCIWIQDAIEKNNKQLSKNTDCRKKSALTPKSPESHRESYPILPRHETGTFPRSGKFNGYAIIEKSDPIKQNDSIAIYDECGAWIGYIASDYLVMYKVRKVKKVPVHISIENASVANNAFVEFHS